jgi:hypothetical protein
MGYPEIDLSSGIEVEKGTIPSLNNITDEYCLYPLQTSDSVLLSDISNIQIKLVTENDIWMSDNAVIYKFEKKTGKCLSKIDKRGDGPEEYISISDFIVDTVENIVLVYDGNKKRINTYDFNGNYKESVPNDFIGSFASLNDSTFIVSYSPLSGHNYHVGFYDRKWNLVCNLMPRNDSIQTNSRLVSFDRLMNLRGQWGIAVPFNDTVYRIDENKSEPDFIISKGHLKISEQIVTDISRKKERAGYIFGEYGFLSASYYFSFYMYQNKIYHDVWDINSRSLLCRNTRSSIEEKEGLLFIIEGKEVYLKPKFVSGNYLYNVIPSYEMMDVIPSLQNDDNPVVVELKLIERNS